MTWVIALGSFLLGGMFGVLLMALVFASRGE